MRLFQIFLLILIPAVLCSCHGRDEIFGIAPTPINTLLLVYSKPGKVDSVSCSPSNFSRNSMLLDSINLKNSDTVKISYTFSSCADGSSYIDMFYFDQANIRRSIHFREINSASTQNVEFIMVSPLIYQRIFIELYTSSVTQATNCLTIRDLNIFKK